MTLQSGTAFSRIPGMFTLKLNACGHIDWRRGVDIAGHHLRRPNCLNKLFHVSQYSFIIAMKPNQARFTPTVKIKS